jgi:DNA-binding FrmR family transcriptional regulator
MLTGEKKKQVVGRLRRIEGQIGGILRMVEEERYCVDVLLQVAAVKAALDRVGQLVLGAHVDTCVNTALGSGDQREARKKVDELMDVFSRFGGIDRR